MVLFVLLTPFYFSKSIPFTPPARVVARDSTLSHGADGDDPIDDIADDNEDHEKDTDLANPTDPTKLPVMGSSKAKKGKRKAV
jgi:hypothetical protein